MMLLKIGTDNKKGIYAIHDGLGNIGMYMPLVGAIRTKAYVYGIETNYESIKNCYSVEELASQYIKNVTADDICLIGFSFGGILAYEMTCQLKEKGKNVMLVLIDSFISRKHSTFLDYLKYQIHYYKKPTYDDLQNVLDALDETELSIIVRKLPDEKRKAIQDVFEKNTYTTLLPDYQGMKGSEIKNRIDTLIKSQDLLEKYCPKKNYFMGNAVFFRAKQNVDNSMRGWKAVLKKNVEFYSIDGDHYSIMQRKNAENIGHILEDYCRTKGETFL